MDEALSKGLTASDRHSRKLARHCMHIHPFCEKCSWGLFWQIYDSADEYSGHLLKSLLTNVVDLHWCLEVSASHISAELVNVLFKRILTHENDNVVRFALQEISTNLALKQFIVAQNVLDWSTLTQAVEHTPAIIQGRAENEKISLLFSQLIINRAFTDFAVYVTTQAKLYFPILHCYLKALVMVAASTVQGVMERSDLVEVLRGAKTFTVSRVASFPSALRPSLVRLVAQLVWSPDSVICRSVSHIGPDDEEVILSFFELVGALRHTPIEVDPSLILAAEGMVDRLVSSVQKDITLDAFVGLAVIAKCDPVTLQRITDTLRDAFKETEHRVYLDITNLIKLAVAFKSEFDFHDFAPLIRLDSNSLFPLMELLVDDSTFSRDIVTALTDRVLAATKSTRLTDQELFSLVVNLGFLSRSACYDMEPELLNNLLEFTVPRVSPEFEIPIPDFGDSTGIVEKMNSREMLHNAFFVFKYRLLSRIVDCGTSVSIPSHVLGEHYEVASPSYMEALNGFTRALLQFNRLESSTEFRIKFCEICFNIVSDRTSQTNAGSVIDSTVLLAFEEADSVYPDLVLARTELMKKILSVTEFANPSLGRLVLRNFVSFFRSLGHADMGVTDQSVAVLADLVMHKEPFNELKEEGFEFGTNQVFSRSILGIHMTDLETQYEATSAFARITTLIAIKESGNGELIRQLTRILLNRVEDYQRAIAEKEGPQTPLPYTPFHQTQLRVYQAICFLAPLIDCETFVAEIEPKLFGPLLTWANQPDCRDYLESLAIFFLTTFKHPLGRLIEILNDFAMPSQAVASFVVVGGFLASQPVEPGTDLKERKRLVVALLPYLSSNVSYLRGVSQMWLHRADEAGVLTAIGLGGEDSVLSPFLLYINSNREAVQMRRRLQPVFAIWDPISVIASGEILELCSSGSMFKNSELVPSAIFMDAVKEGVHEALRDNWFFTRDLDTLINDYIDKERVKIEELEVHAESAGHRPNSQKKYCPEIDSMFPALGEQTDQKSRRRETDLVVVTTLVEKTVNIAGLCRTAEVFGAKKLVVPTMNVVKDGQFSSMSVTAEQWIDIEAVTEKELPRFLNNLKESGYTVVCLEQTHDSIEIQKFQFPQKTCLVLGNEKSGVPVDALPLMDICVEIPQRGVIRSLNVHVSGAIAMWQYNHTCCL